MTRVVCVCVVWVLPDVADAAVLGPRRLGDQTSAAGALLEHDVVVCVHVVVLPRLLRHLARTHEAGHVEGRDGEAPDADARVAVVFVHVQVRDLRVRLFARVRVEEAWVEEGWVQGTAADVGRV